MCRLNHFLSWFLLVSTFSGVRLFCDEIPVRVKIRDPYQSQYNSMIQDIEFFNGHNRYILSYYQQRASENRAPHTSLHLNFPTLYGSFSRPMDFSKLIVNGISLSVLDPKPQDIKKWEGKNAAGAEIAFNFDGAHVMLRFYMRTDSPMLFVTVRHGKDSVTPIQSMTLKVDSMPSGLTYDKKRKIIWQGEQFARQAVTATRTIEAEKHPVPMLAEDRYFILQDAINNGTYHEEQKDNRENIGPCFFTCDLTSGINTGKIIIRKSAYVNMIFDLHPDKEEFRYGVWQHKNRHTNQQFLKMFEKNKRAFLLN